MIKVVLLDDEVHCTESLEIILQNLNKKVEVIAKFNDPELALAFIKNNQWTTFLLILLAVLIGIIPESGPHLIFVILFFNGSIPFSILLSSSIVQDGHGALPLLASSRSNFFLMKAISVLVGLCVGLLGFFLGF